jgi:hypothetical protein
MGGSLCFTVTCIECSVARIRELKNYRAFDPGAYAPGFMPAPAPQALVQSSLRN